MPTCCPTHRPRAIACRRRRLALGGHTSSACGAVAEWSKALAWKVSIRQNRIEGSNPSRSATLGPKSRLYRERVKRQFRTSKLARIHHGVSG